MSPCALTPFCPWFLVILHRTVPWQALIAAPVAGASRRSPLLSMASLFTDKSMDGSSSCYPTWRSPFNDAFFLPLPLKESFVKFHGAVSKAGLTFRWCLAAFSALFFPLTAHSLCTAGSWHKRVLPLPLLQSFLIFQEPSLPPFPTLLVSTCFSRKNSATCCFPCISPPEAPCSSSSSHQTAKAPHPSSPSPVSSSPTINCTRGSGWWGQRQQTLHLTTELKCHHHMAQSDENEARCARAVPLLSQKMPPVMQTGYSWAGSACVGWEHTQELKAVDLLTLLDIPVMHPASLAPGFHRRNRA